jgi:hypothetical protein
MAFLSTFLLVFLGALGLVSSANYYFNLGHTFRAEYSLERWAADVLNDGLYIHGNFELNNPAIHKFLIEKQDSAPDTIVLGSSRSMQIKKHHIPSSGTFLNHSVDSAYLQDLLGLFAIYDSRGLFPKRVVIGVDPWTFKFESLFAGARLYHREADAFSKKLGDTRKIIELSPTWSFSDLISINRFLSGFALKNSNVCDKQLSARTAESSCAVRNPDGTLIYPKSWRNRPTSVVSSSVKLSVSRRGVMHGFDNFFALAPQQKKLFEQFIRYLISHDIKVSFFLSPYHPIVAQSKKETPNWRLVKEAEAYVRLVAGNLGADIFGSYDPANLTCGEEDFFDNLHTKPRCLDVIFTNAH